MTSTERVPYSIDLDTAEKVVKLNKRVSEYFHLLANEPSTGLYHVQEHVKKSTPKLVTATKELENSQQKIKDATTDIEYASEELKNLHGLTTFSSIKQLMTQTMDTINNIDKGKLGVTPEKVVEPEKEPIPEVQSEES